ncbi:MULTISPECIES: TlyA family RNA methyltransferase [unclassified Arthrobacter]|uniref:TlyA family RNA methyltransferase n=1 Tax=unclassified Arthrobacter TaxID=235627 RepID=UPI001E2C5986|nr:MULTISPECIES: TlyA family RNA methyltransferase [unclassified Arthrobacter]MCC9144976.1 TlyA family RNA methyltransferase [Arthrobacter sp. zg-Y919]MDK1276204.1 TlyA family RNA methyltransferase [Arthrobacter sp. zg.Y919]WIB02183.1 TlyA family RNA methyltransferase [Arthrobacter sp. zg-Y919]
MPRLDQELVTRGLARSRTQAAKLIAAGRVLRAGKPAAKPSAPVDAGERLEVLDDGLPDYVSRAGHKLAGALAAFPAVNPVGLRCLDAGASTGGFTDVLLRAGATHVAAVDVGHGQLVEALRRDPRVSVYEGMNVRYLDPEDIGGTVDLTVADLSFISLTKVVGPLAAATRPGGSLLLMVKPQFEVGREKLDRTGVVTDPARHRSAVASVATAAMAAGLEIGGIAPSPLPGQNGNVEFFMWLQVPGPVPGRPAETGHGEGTPAEDAAARLVDEAFAGFADRLPAVED